MNKEDRVSQEDHYIIQSAKANVAYMALMVEKTMAEKRASEAEYRNIILRAFMKYGLTGNDTIDNNGNIIRVEVVAVPEETIIPTEEELILEKKE